MRKNPEIKQKKTRKNNSIYKLNKKIWNFINFIKMWKNPEIFSNIMKLGKNYRFLPMSSKYGIIMIFDQSWKHAKIIVFTNYTKKYEILLTS